MADTKPWRVWSPGDEADEIHIAILDQEYEQWAERAFAPEDAKEIIDALNGQVGDA